MKSAALWFVAAASFCAGACNKSEQKSQPLSNPQGGITMPDPDLERQAAEAKAAQDKDQQDKADKAAADKADKAAKDKAAADKAKTDKAKETPTPTPTPNKT